MPFAHAVRQKPAIFTFYIFDCSVKTCVVSSELEGLKGREVKICLKKFIVPQVNKQLSLSKNKVIVWISNLWAITKPRASLPHTYLGYLQESNPKNQNIAHNWLLSQILNKIGGATTRFHKFCSNHEAYKNQKRRFNDSNLQSCRKIGQ